MTTFESPIVLGQKYVDERSGLIGYASFVGFNENGCVDVGIEHSHSSLDGKIEITTDNINELRLTRAPDESESRFVKKQTYESDIVLGRHYRDKQTGLEGWATIIDFYEKMATRVTIRSVGIDKDGAKVLKYHVLDDFLLIDIETEKQAERRNPKRSPATREVAARH